MSTSTPLSQGAACDPPAAGAPRVIVVGGGFGGLEAVKALRHFDGEITLIDRHNYHLFQPLSYQVATGGLSPAEIATPLRHIFRRQRQVRVLLGEVVGFDLGARQVVARADVPGAAMRLAYDALIVAGGSDYSYFGHDEWRRTALEVKSLDSALEVRGRILHAFEAAERNPCDQKRWLTFVVVGAGPTGVEMAGQIAELARETLASEFRQIDPTKGRVILVEMTDKVLGAFPDPLPARAARSLERLGVKLMLGHTVVNVEADRVELQDTQGVKTELPTQTVIWAAGVRASPLARILAEAAGAETDRSGRVTVESDLSLPGHPEVLALGDMVRVRDASSGAPITLPGLAPVAMQQGRYAARSIARRLADEPAPPPFHYRDKGSLATIGRARAVADLRGLRFSGGLAWLAWLSIHIFFLIGFQNRVVVILRWSYSYFTRGRSSRLITDAAALPTPPGTRADSGPVPSLLMGVADGPEVTSARDREEPT